jgi:hypothetical protein
MHEGLKTERKTGRRLVAVVGVAGLALMMAGCGGGKGKAIEEGAETVGQLLREGHLPEVPQLPHSAEIPRLPGIPAGGVQAEWTVAAGGQAIERRAVNGLETYSEQVTLRPNAAEDGQITTDDEVEWECYAKIIVLGPGSVNRLVEGQTVYQRQPDGGWQLVQNELQEGFPTSACEVVQNAIEGDNQQ